MFSSRGITQARWAVAPQRASTSWIRNYFLISVRPFSFSLPLLREVRESCCQSSQGSGGVWRWRAPILEGNFLAHSELPPGIALNVSRWWAMSLRGEWLSSVFTEIIAVGRLHSQDSFYFIHAINAWRILRPHSPVFGEVIACFPACVRSSSISLLVKSGLLIQPPSLSFLKTVSNYSVTDRKGSQPYGSLKRYPTCLFCFSYAGPQLFLEDRMECVGPCSVQILRWKNAS